MLSKLLREFVLTRNYHVNEKGCVNLCQAEPGFCPISSVDAHDSSKENVQKFYEDFMDNLTNKNKSVRFYFISGTERNAFTTGDCAHFAKCLNKNAGLPIFYLGDKETGNGNIVDKRWSHFVNKLPDGRFIDVEGIWTEKDLLKRWHVDELGSGWMPDSINPAESHELRKMGVASPMFPQISPSKTLTKMRKNLEPFINLRK